MSSTAAPLRGLTLFGYGWLKLRIALAVMSALRSVGIPLDVRNFRSVYR